jgi:uncharacterized protein
MTVLVGLLRILALVAVVCIAAGAEVAIPPTPTEWVTDTANFLSPQTIAAQNARLNAYEKRSGHQVLVYIAPTTAEQPIEDWTVRAFEAWKVGRKGLDDGAVLFIFPRDRTVRIEVGYGLESVLPDVTASRIIRNTIVPEIRAGRPDGAVVAGIDRMLAAIGANDGASAADAPAPLSPLTLILIGLGILAFIVLAVNSPSTALFLLFTVMGRGGGSMGGGGGFSGGGGRSGGGGASGRW